PSMPLPGLSAASRRLPGAPSPRARAAGGAIDQLPQRELPGTAGGQRARGNPLRRLRGLAARAAPQPRAGSHVEERGGDGESFTSVTANATVSRLDGGRASVTPGRQCGAPFRPLARRIGPRVTP